MSTAIERLSEREVILSLRRCLGNYAMTSKELGITRGELQDYIVNNPIVREEKRQITESLLDEAEELAFKKMHDSDSILMFILRTRGKDRGYETRNALSGPGGKPIQVEVNARTLIAAMREGMGFSDESNGEEVDSGSDIQQFVPEQLNGSGS